MKKLITFLTLLTLFFTTAWAGTVTDVLNRAFTGVNSGAGYSNWSGKTATSSAVYAGNSAGGNNSIQLRNGSNSCIYTTSSGGKVKSVSVTWNSNTANSRRLVIYGKHTPYTSGTQVYNVNDHGERLGYIYHGDATGGTTTTLTVNGDYEYIAFFSVSNAIYLDDVTIIWDTGGDPVEQPTISLSPDGPYFEGDDVTATMSCTTEGATIYYKLNDDANWTEYNSSNPPTFNTATTIQAKAVLGEVESEVNTRTVSFGPSVSTVTQLVALADNTQFKFSGSLVVSGKSGNQLYAQDATGGIHFYGSAPFTRKMM